MIRIFKIIASVARYRLDDLVNIQRLPFWLRWCFYLMPWRYLIVSEASRGERIRLLEVLGPIFIKFGQLLSTRRDLLPDDISNELAQLQDNVPPFSADESVAIIERALGKPVGELFAQFDHIPLASASIAQVHTAILHSGEHVVVKVICPDIEQVIRKDIRLMYFLAKLLISISKEAQRLRPIEVVADYERTIIDELGPNSVRRQTVRNYVAILQILLFCTYRKFIGITAAPLSW